MLADLWLLLGAGTACNVLLLGGLLLIWSRLTERRRLKDRLLRELRHLRHGESEEALLRKVGLIRDLNDLGAAPGELEEIYLKGADLRGVLLNGCRLRAARMEGADLQGASLEGADLFGADLSRANLALASLRNAGLRGANLEGARLTKARLEGASLRRANLVNADVQGVRLETVRLELARFAAGGGGLFRQTIHPSVEDWIRARLDHKGRFVGSGEAKSAPPSLSDAV